MFRVVLTPVSPACPVSWLAFSAFYVSSIGVPCGIGDFDHPISWPMVLIQYVCSVPCGNGILRSHSVDCIRTVLVVCFFYLYSCFLYLILVCSCLVLFQCSVWYWCVFNCTQSVDWINTFYLCCLFALLSSYLCLNIMMYTWCSVWYWCLCTQSVDLVYIFLSVLCLLCSLYVCVQCSVWYWCSLCSPSQLIGFTLML